MKAERSGGGVTATVSGDRQTSAQRHPGGSPGPTRGGEAARNKSDESTTTTSSSNSPGRADTSARARAQPTGERKGERPTRAPEDTRASRSGTANEPNSRPTPEVPPRRPTHGEDRKVGGQTTDSKESRENESVSAPGTTDRDAKVGAQNGTDDRGDKRERRRPKTTGPSKDDQRTGRHETPPGEKEESARKRTPGDHRRATAFRCACRLRPPKGKVRRYNLGAWREENTPDLFFQEKLSGDSKNQTTVL